MVLAGTDLGPQPAHLRSQSRLAGYFWNHVQFGEGHLRRGRGRRLLRRRRPYCPFSILASQSEELSAHEPAAVFAHDVFFDNNDSAADQDRHSASLPHQVRVYYAVV